MLTFKEMAEPAEGWALDRVERTRAGLWEVTLFRPTSDGPRYLTGSASSNLETAWGSARIAAENADVLAKRP